MKKSLQLMQTGGGEGGERSFKGFPLSAWAKFVAVTQIIVGWLYFFSTIRHFTDLLSKFPIWVVVGSLFLHLFGISLGIILTKGIYKRDLSLINGWIGASTSLLVFMIIGHFGWAWKSDDRGIVELIFGLFMILYDAFELWIVYQYRCDLKCQQQVEGRV